MRPLSIALSAVVTIAAALLSSGVARADGCVPGQVATEDTEGRCCWPGQQWSDEYNRCTGAPQCPEGFYGSGSECVTMPSISATSSAAAPAPPPPPQETRQLDLRPPPETELPYLGGPIPLGWHVEERNRKGLVIAGFIMLAAGYASSAEFALVAPLTLAATNTPSSCTNSAGLIPLIPVVGAAIGGIAFATNPDCGGQAGLVGLNVVEGVAISGVQIAGLVMGIYGLTHKNRFLVYDHPVSDNGRGGVEVALVPANPGAIQGLSLVATF